MLAVIGILAALTERATSGEGQVVDAAIVEGVLLTATVDRFLRLRDGWGPRGTNALDGGSHFYRCYRTADERWISFGALEFFFSSRRRHTRLTCDWSSDVCSSD